MAGPATGTQQGEEAWFGGEVTGTAKPRTPRAGTCPDMRCACVVELADVECRHMCLNWRTMETCAYVYKCACMQERGERLSFGGRGSYVCLCVCVFMCVCTYEYMQERGRRGGEGGMEGG